MDSAISGDIIVYTDYRGADANIWYYDLATSTENAVTTDRGDQVLNDVSGGIITYDHYNFGDVFTYDIATRTTTDITGNYGSGGCAREPAIGGNLLAWAQGGDIYAKDLATGEQRRITNTPASDRAVAVGGGIIVWQGCDPTCHIFTYDWDAATTTRISDSTCDERDPDTNGNIVVYSARPATGGGGDICYYDIDTGVETRIVLPGDQMNPNISGDYVSFEDIGTGISHIRLLDITTDTVYDLNIPATSQQFLNDIDGNRIVYTDDRAGRYDVYMYTFVEPASEIPPSEQLTDILEFFDESVANGNLEGSGPGKSVQGRLGALRNMIESVGYLIDQGRFDEAAQQLQNAYDRVDGRPRPPDFAQGSAAAQLAAMIQELIDSL